MADRDRQSQIQPPRYDTSAPRLYGQKGGQSQSQKQGPSTSQILVTIALLPLCGILLTLAGITLAGTLIGLALATPLFFIFSPILAPAAILVAGAVIAFLTSGAFGLTGLTSLSWVVNAFKTLKNEAQEQDYDPIEAAKRRMQDAGAYIGEKTKQTGDAIKNKAQEEDRRAGGATATAGGRG